MSKKIHIRPIDTRKILNKSSNLLLRCSIFIVVFILFICFYKLTNKGFSNDYILDVVLKDNIYSRNCFVLFEKDSKLLQKIDYFYKNIDDKTLVPHVFFKNMPITIASEEDVSIKKSVYINILLPTLLKVQKEVLKERSRLVEISSRMSMEPLVEEDFLFLDDLSKKYHYQIAGDKFWNYVDALDSLLLRVDIIPNSLVLAVSAKETDWGSNIELIKDNAFFSEFDWYSTQRIVSLLREKELIKIVKKFNNIDEAVRSFYIDINTNDNYTEFRKVRRNMRLTEGTLKTARLVQKFNYSKEKGYENSLMQIISSNSLEKFNNYHDFSRKNIKKCIEFV